MVLADKLDTTVLGFMLDRGAAELAESVYNVVSKPFVQLRQTGWMLAYMVMPAVASLAAARDDRGLERVKYDGTRLHIGVLAAGRACWPGSTPARSSRSGSATGWATTRRARPR